ncbi:heme oxygenase-like protein [Gloeophyllum trabeum ATCC 11539]|uniref:Heme oxygenase-like protein n=1 Tax=Gloeophyllum trabeum (strain ATCC 11539 / FP-39264 / Madison 617) TaxID=670483 RepID=S7RHX3_GLOTA|nr:heme oxygenase-like protein [Gloeophyllum trabeum ATCC 11539]EPQ52199.1 heme oxygenase-like protein [Gloeophyllum trabeum ATCC 11539]
MTAPLAIETLTSRLVSLSTPRPYAAAVEHEFLTSCGDGTITHDRLAFWLYQDRLYAAHAYPRFIGLLIAKIPYSSGDRIASAVDRRNQRILKMLTYALENVEREVAFFEETSREWGLDIEGWKERKATRDYTAEMLRVATLGSLQEGLVFLWAMERAYLDSWRYVGSVLDKFTTTHALTPTTTAVSNFVSNWTNAEFIRFVDDLADLVNELGITAGTDAWKKAEEVWARVVELEEAFWPEKGEEKTMKLVD